MGRWTRSRGACSSHPGSESGCGASRHIDSASFVQLAEKPMDVRVQDLPFEMDDLETGGGWGWGAWRPLGR